MSNADARNGPEYDLDHRDHHPDDALKQIRTAGSISISPELFEKIYLSPQNQVKGDIRRTFGNPTPVAIGGFLMALTPLSNVLLGWRQSGGLGAANIGTYFYFGGLLMLLGGFLEFILGNTFPFVVFSTFGAFWLTFGSTLQPFFNAANAYDPGAGLKAAFDPAFARTYAFWLVYMGVLCLVYLIASSRTNLVFFSIFLLLVPTFGCLAMAFFRIAEGNLVSATAFKHAGAGMAFAVSILGWYLFLVQMLASVDFPINLPVVDLSTVVKGGSDRMKAKQEASNGNDVERSGGSKMKFWKKS